MKYSIYAVEDFVRDEYFQKWVLNSDSMTDVFWENWLVDYPYKKAEVEKAKRLVLLMNFDLDELPEQDFDGIWRNIIEKRNDSLHGQKSHRKTRSRFLAKSAIFFLIVIAIGLGLYKYKFLSWPEKKELLSEPSITLQLEDGTISVLDETSSKILTNGAGDNIVQQKNILNYRDNNTKTLSYNILTVPYGKKFGIVLSDGSEVFLNSGSKIRYPVGFMKEASRNVYLDGEAFFTVSKDTLRPFTVITDDMNTQVYGTAFNVSSYKNEKNTSTVLVAGSVGVYKANNEEAGKPIIIHPKQRAVYMDNEIVVEKVMVSKYISWKDNKLLFIDDSFDLILKELERHFNVTIENTYSALNQKKFTGTFENESLKTILMICQEHTPFNFSIDDNKVIIKAIK